MGWTGAHHEFAVETCFKTGKSVIAMQGDFHVHFMLPQNNAALERIFNP